MAKQTEFEHPPAGHVGILGYDLADDHWHAIYVDDSGRLQIDVAVAEPVDVHEHQYDGSEWRKSNLLWGYNANWDENLGGTATGTTYTKNATVVPANQLWVLQAISLANVTRAMTYVYIQIYKASGGLVILAFAASLAQYVPLLVVGTFTLAVGDYLQVTAQSTVSGDSLKGGLCGYKMKLNM